MSKISFEKQGYTFEFADFEWRNNNLYASWKVVGYHENKRNSEGYFFNASYYESKNAFLTDGLKIDRKKVSGVTLPDNIDIALIIEEAKKENERELLEHKAMLDEQYTKETELSISHHSSIGFILGEFANSTLGLELKSKLKSNSQIESSVVSALNEFQTDIDLGDYTLTTYYKISVAEFENIVNTITNEVEEKLKEKKEKEEAERKAIFDKAKETGEPQILNKWSAPCNDPNEECNVDLVYIYAMPDGTTKKERHHTW